MNHIIYVLAGPTGIGKSGFALSLAVRHNGEIISADSRQIYRYMDIGTAKPSPKERDTVPHHLIDNFLPDEIVSAGRYRELAYEAVRDIWRRGKNVFLTGGSGLYIRAVIKGIFKGPGRDDRIRKRLEREIGTFGSISLYDRLKKIDKERALRLHPNDSRRIIRALEVYEITGKKISDWEKEASWEQDASRRNSSSGGNGWVKTPIVVCLYQDMRELYRRIDARVDEMIDNGLVEEVRGIVEKGFGNSFAIKDAIGYKEILDYLDGRLSLGGAIELLKKNSRRLAKKQMTWFRGEKGIKWVEKRQGKSEGELLAEVEEVFGLREESEKLAKTAVW